MASVLMSSSRSSGARRSAMRRSSSPRSWRRMSSGSLVRKRTRFPGVREIKKGASWEILAGLFEELRLDEDRAQADRLPRAIQQHPVQEEHLQGAAVRAAEGPRERLQVFLARQLLLDRPLGRLVHDDEVPRRMAQHLAPGVAEDARL